LNFVRELWNRLVRLPGGKMVFSKAVGQAAPYTGSIGARVLDLKTGYARVAMADRRGLRNHLQCVHAVALVNLAELTGNLSLAYGMPDDARFIVLGLSIEYLAKARGTITAECQAPIVANNERAEFDLEVNLSNESNEVVARAIIKSLVGPKKKKQSDA
jgi:acyl-coenzyme A thioesterase PaaI-like protein